MAYVWYCRLGPTRVSLTGTYWFVKSFTVVVEMPAPGLGTA